MKNLLGFYRKSIAVCFGITITVGAVVWYSCLSDSHADLVFYEKKTIPDTTISVGESLNLDLTEYYELRWEQTSILGSTDDGLVEYPKCEPSIEDTSIAGLNYNYQTDIIGRNFSIIGKKEGTTTVHLHLTWMACEGTVEAKKDRDFKLTVVKRS